MSGADVTGIADEDDIMEAQDVAAIWFTVYFGLCLLVPAFGWTCKAVWNMGRKK
jgi:hypothetical protein